MSFGVLIALLGGGYFASRLLHRSTMKQAGRAVSNMARATAGAGGSTAPGVSAATLEQLSYLKHEHGFLPKMTRSEALMILGFPDDAAPSQPEMEKKFRHVLASHHDDVGGSPLVSRKVIEARQFLKESL